MGDLSSPTRDQTCALPQWKFSILTAELPGKPQQILELSSTPGKQLQICGSGNRGREKTMARSLCSSKPLSPSKSEQVQVH